MTNWKRFNDALKAHSEAMFSFLPKEKPKDDKGEEE